MSLAPALARIGRRLVRPAPSRASLVLAGLLWAALCVVLDHAGHAPSRPPLPVARWYRVQALLLPVLVPAMGELAAWIARARLRRLGCSPEPRDGASVRLALAVGLSFFVLVDAVAFARLGFAQLAPASAVGGLGAVVLMVGLAARGLHQSGLPWPRAGRVAALALGIAGAAGSLLLR